MTGSMLNVEPSIANAVPVESITEKHWQSVTYQYSSRRVTINAADLLRAIGQWCPEPDNGERMYCGPSDVIPLMIRCGILTARHRCQPPVPPAMHRPPQPLHASPFSYTHPRLPPHRGPAHPDCVNRWQLGRFRNTDESRCVRLKQRQALIARQDWRCAGFHACVQ